MYSSSSYASAVPSVAWLPIVTLILAIAGTVLAYIFIIPKSKVKNLNKFWYFVHNVFNFKTLLVEKIFKALYVYATINCIVTGFLMLFSSFLTGLLIMILGPIAARIVFEMIMMFIMLVQNTNALRNKFCGDGDDILPADAPLMEKQPPKEYVFCPACGTRFNKLDGRCPGCGQPLQGQPAPQTQAPAAPAWAAQTQAPSAPTQPGQAPAPAAPVLSGQTQAPTAPAQGYGQPVGYGQPGSFAQRPASSYGQGGEGRQGYAREHRRFQSPQG